MIRRSNRLSSGGEDVTLGAGTSLRDRGGDPWLAVMSRDVAPAAAASRAER